MKFNCINKVQDCENATICPCLMFMTNNNTIEALVNPTESTSVTVPYKGLADKYREDKIFEDSTKNFGEIELR